MIAGLRLFPTILELSPSQIVSRTFLEAYHLTAITTATGHAVGGTWTFSLDAPLRQGTDLTETKDRVYLSPYWTKER